MIFFAGWCFATALLHGLHLPYGSALPTSLHGAPFAGLYGSSSLFAIDGSFTHVADTVKPISEAKPSGLSSLRFELFLKSFVPSCDFPSSLDTEEWVGRRRGEEERQRRIWRRSAAIGGVGVGGAEKEENQKRIWRRSAIGVGEEYVGGEWVDEWRRRGEGEDAVLRRRPAPGRGVTAMGRRGGIVSYTDFGPIDLPPQRPAFLRPRPVLDSQGRIGERWVEEGRGVEGKKGEREERRLEVKEGRGREPPSGPFLRNERGFSGLQQRRSECYRFLTP